MAVRVLLVLAVLVVFYGCGQSSPAPEELEKEGGVEPKTVTPSGPGQPETTQGGRSEPGAAATSSPKPNFVFILADDMRKDDLRYMPKTKALLKDQGMTFTNAFVSNSLCCPSRATIMRGQYSHNTGVWTNHSPGGWWEAYKEHEQDNVATRLDDAGYRTALLGKYFNGYHDTTYVPPGWDRWFGAFGFKYFDYDVNDNGRIRHFGTDEDDYVTDVLSRETQKFIGASASKPFFAYVAPIAPHTPYVPAPRHRHEFDGLMALRPPSFNEQDVSDKPPWIQESPVLDDSQLSEIDEQQEGRAELLQSLDDLVEEVVGKLRAEGELKNTYVVFTSDNGYQLGEHRIPKGKTQPYEESIRMPLLIRGPGVEAGVRTNKLALNTDYLPTFTDLAGIQTPEYVDGRSLQPLLEGSPTIWRSAILLERREVSVPAYEPFYGIRTSGGRKYIEYEDGFRELYDLRTDPYELSNSYDATAPPAELATRLQALKGCAGATCRAAEDGP